MVPDHRPHQTLAEIGKRVYVQFTGAHHRQHTTTGKPMFFTLPDGTRYQAKCTKKGQFTHGVAVQLCFPASDGSDVFHWTLASQHLNIDAASKSARREQSRPHFNCQMVITAQ